MALAGDLLSPGGEHSLLGPAGELLGDFLGCTSGVFAYAQQLILET